MKEEDLGVAILSMKTPLGSLESHLLIAVTSEDLRGKYECFSSANPNVAQKTFLIGSKKIISPFFINKQLTQNRANISLHH